MGEGEDSGAGPGCPPKRSGGPGRLGATPMVERQAFKREEEVMMKDGEELCIKPSQQTVLETTVQKLKEKKFLKLLSKKERLVSGRQKWGEGRWTVEKGLVLRHLYAWNPIMPRIIL